MLEIEKSMLKRGGPIPASEMRENDGVAWFRDDCPTHGASANDITDEDKRVMEFLFSRSAVMTGGIISYVYCRAVALWAQLYSEMASNELLKVTGINASVKY